MTAPAELWRATVHEKLSALGKAILERHFVGFAIEPGDRVSFLVRDLGAKLILEQEVTLCRLLAGAFHTRDVVFVIDRSSQTTNRAAAAIADLDAARRLATRRISPNARN
jgi:hypothetical protein